MSRRSWSVEELVEGVRSGDRKALARAISLVENRDPVGDQVVSVVYPSTGNALSIGITGPPGVGKSSLVAALVRQARDAGSSVGVVSVDPSSPFSHGALLGDRIRLAEHFLDPGVYIRSMGTRGHLGGLAEATLQALLLLDAAGKEIVFLETVGTGQSEVEVAGIADLVVLVLMPGSGDSVQALKAGIMEIPDVIAINKSDLPFASAMLDDVRSIIALEPDQARRPALVATSVSAGEGIVGLWEALERRRAALRDAGELDARRRQNLEGEALGLAALRLRRRLDAAIEQDPGMRAVLDAVGRRELDPLRAAATLADAIVAAETFG